MDTEITPKHFIISSLPRSGSTTLARLVSSHPSLHCLIEPFHPDRYEGHFHKIAVVHSPHLALHIIWKRWAGIKHVWESSGWPFLHKPGLNEELVIGRERKIIVLIRRNFLRRAVSNLISRQTNYWIGTRAGFLRQLERTQLRALSPRLLRDQICRDKSALENHLRCLADTQADLLRLDFEDVFSTINDPAQQLLVVNRLLAFLQVGPIDPSTFSQTYQRHFDADVNRWATPDIYYRIPGIERIEQELGSDETGWLLR